MSSEFKKIISSTKALSIVEVLVAMAIFAVVGSTIVFLVIDSTNSETQSDDVTVATEYGQEALDAVLSIKEINWIALSSRIGVNTYGLSESGGVWGFSGTNNIFDKFTRTITIQAVYRDAGGTGDIVPQATPGAVLDIYTVKVLINVSWTDPGNSSISLSEYLANWQSIDWLEDTTAQFSDGTFTTTEANASMGDGDGAITLQATAGTGPGPQEYKCLAYPLGSLNMTGTTDALAIDATATHVFVGQGANLVSINVTSPNSPSTVQTLAMGGNINSVRISGSFAYVTTAADAAELRIVNISNPAAMSITGTFNSAGNFDGTDAFVVGNRAYLTTLNNASGSEFYIVNITTPATPTQVGSFNVGGNSYGVHVSGTTAFVVTNIAASELVNINITTEASPTLRSVLDTSGSRWFKDIEISGSTAFITTGSSYGRVYAVNISNPAAPTETSFYTYTGNDFNRIRIVGNYAFIGAEGVNDDVVVLDISNPASMVQKSVFDHTGPVNDLVVSSSGSYVFVASDSDTQEMASLEAPVEDTWRCYSLKSSINIPDTATNLKSFVQTRGATTYAFFLFSTTLNRTLSSYDVTNPASPVLVSSLNFGILFNINDFYMEGNYAYLATTNDTQEMIIVDTTNPASMSISGSYNSTGTIDATDVFVIGNRAYLTTMVNGGGSEFYILNVTNPASPALASGTSHFDAATDVLTVHVSGSFAYLGQSNNGQELRILNIANESSITAPGALNVTGNDNGATVFYSNNYVYLSNGPGNSLFIINVTNPAAPVVTTTIVRADDVVKTYVNGNYLFIATMDNTNEFVIYDVTNHASPLQIARYSNASIDPTDIFFHSNWVYFGNLGTSNEVRIFELTSLTIVGASGFVASGSYQSDQFNTGANRNFIIFKWSQSLTGCGGCTIQFQVRTAPDSGGSPGTWTAWNGATGNNTYFTNSTGTTIPVTLSGNRWVQYRFEMTGNTTNTPVVSDVTVNYR